MRFVEARIPVSVIVQDLPRVHLNSVGSAPLYVGAGDGADVGADVGAGDGAEVGVEVGDNVGAEVSEGVGVGVGAEVGCVGAGVGTNVGTGVGAEVLHGLPGPAHSSTIASMVGSAVVTGSEVPTPYA